MTATLVLPLIGVSFLFASAVFKGGKLERWTRWTFFGMGLTGLVPFIDPLIPLPLVIFICRFHCRGSSTVTCASSPGCSVSVQHFYQELRRSASHTKMKGVEMSNESFTTKHRTLGRVAAWAVFSVSVIYTVTLVLGFLSLKSPQEPIGDPYVSILELLIILLAPLMVVSMVAVHAYASPEDKAYSFTALAFMILLAGTTSSVHFVVLTVSRQIESTGLTWAPLFFSFKWPSVAYTLDILAWDFFFALSMLFAAPAFKGGGLQKVVRYLMVASGILSLIGLIGVPLAIMNVGYWFSVRNIGIVGYAVVAPVAFLLLAIVFGRTKRVMG